MRDGLIVVPGVMRPIVSIAAPSVLEIPKGVFGISGPSVKVFGHVLLPVLKDFDPKVSQKDVLVMIKVTVEATDDVLKGFNVVGKERVLPKV